MAYGTALVLIIIVLISNLLANALRKYYGKVKNELIPLLQSGAVINGNEWDNSITLE
jgi:hypothetical protein